MLLSLYMRFTSVHVRNIWIFYILNIYIESSIKKNNPYYEEDDKNERRGSKSASELSK